MRAVVVIAAIAIACLAGLAIWQLTEDDSGGEREGLAPPPETADQLPKLPRGWTKTVNGAGGFALGVPPGWSAKNAAGRTTLKSPGSTVVVRITADRTDEAVDTGLESFASGIAEAIEPGAVAAPLEPPAPLAPGYEAAGVAVPRGKGGRQEVFVVRRAELAAYPLVIASGKGVKRRQLDPIVETLVRSLRGRPVGPAG